MDFSQQPLPVAPEATAQNPVEVIEEGNTQQPPIFAEDDLKAPVEAVTMPAPSAPPPPETVAVETAPLVAAEPRNQRVYTSSGVVELTPPASLRSRSELPQSRYYERRQVQTYRTRNTTH
jgi:hypothetical protein